jgi:hypothetical protein
MNPATAKQAVAPEPTIKALQNQFWPRELLLGLMPLLIGFQLLVWVAYLRGGLNGVGVFRSFYVAGYMVRTHQSADIHDQEKHLELADELVPLGLRLNQGMDHPAYEALLFAPLSWFSYRKALIVFIFLNFGVIAWCIRPLSRKFQMLSDRWKPFPALLFTAFFPVTYAITGGNDSMILLALLVGAWIALERNKDWHAGLLTGLAVFKFQVVIPVAVLFLIWKRWRFVGGFAITSSIAALISLLLVGLHGAKQLVAMLLGMSLTMKSAVDAEKYAVSPRTMFNLRGLLSAALGSHLGHWWMQGLIFSCSVAVLILIARRRPSLPLAVLAAALVSYHLNAPDAVVLLIPIGLFLCSNSVPATLAGIAALIAPSVAIWPLYGFIGAIPILMLFIFYLSDSEFAYVS